MADLTTAGRTHAANLADRVGREVVVQEEVGAVIAVQRVDDLLIFAGAKGSDDEALGFTPGEQCRAMRPRQDAGFADDRADGLGVATVDPGAFLDHVTAQNRRFQLLDRRVEVRVGGVFLAHLRGDRGHGGFDRGGAFLLVTQRESGAHQAFASLLHLAVEVREIGRREVVGFLGRMFGEVDDQVDDRLHLLMAEHHGTEHFLFGQLVSLGFHHHNGVLGAGDDEVQALLGLHAQLRHVVHRRVQHVLAVDKADTRRADRAHERDARDGEGGRGRDHRHDVGVIHQVAGQHGRHDQHFVAEAVDEERTDRTVDQAGDERLFLRRTRLALEEAAGDLAGCVVLFLVVNGQREEVLARLRRFREGHVGHHLGFAQRRDHRPIGLTRNFPGFQSERFIAPLDRFLGHIEHVSFPLRTRPLPVPSLSGGPIAALSPVSFACAPGAGLTSQMAGLLQEKSCE